MKKVNKIVIVGGGSSGWMTAAILVKRFPEMDITLIESSDIPTIGVGESTIGHINKYLATLGIKDEEWMPSCNATYKTTIDFTNWDGKGTRCRYPFGQMTYLGNEEYKPVDWFIKKTLFGEENSPKDQFADFVLNTTQMIRKGKLTKDDTWMPGWNFDNDTAYHMDAGLFGQWLKTDYCKPRGITHIVDNVIGTNINDNGHLDSIKTKDSGDLSADLFVDCTGFKSLLLEGVMKEPFISFEDKLLSDKAVAIRIPYKDRELEMETATNATTLSSGWSWNIPLWNRIGTGYVYSSKFLSPEDAEKELREYLINDRDVPHDREEIEAIPAWHIDIKAGIHERSWVNNVVAIGLANGFIEPLESTGLMLTHEALSVLVDSLEHRDARINMIDVEIFNARVRTKMNDFSGFISSHYAFCERDDTPYWKYVTEELTYTEQWKEKNNTWSYYSDVIEYLMINDDWNLPPHAGLPFIMAAFGFNPVTKHKLQLHFGHDITEEDEPWIASVKLDKDIKEAVKWLSDYADELPTHYEFLKEHIYTDE